MFIRFFRRNRSAFFLAAILGLIFSSAFFIPSRGIRLGIGLASVLALGGGGVLLSAGKWWHLTFCITAVIALALQVFAHSAATPLELRVTRDAFLLVIFVLCIHAVLRHALFTPDVLPFDRILASICGYFLLALLGANIFSLITEFDPDAFEVSGENPAFDARTSVYFSLITISTQGYGDILPRSPVARIAAGLFGATGTIYLAVIIGAMVSSLASMKGSPDHDHD